MNPKTDSGDGWEACPEGALQALSKRTRQRRSIKRAALMIPLTVLVLLALTWSGLVPMPFGSNVPLLCDQVEKLLPAYASNTLSASQRERVLKHLNKCPFCRAKLQEIQAAQAVAYRDSGIDAKELSWVFGVWSNDFVRRPLAIDG